MDKTEKRIEIVAMFFCLFAIIQYMSIFFTGGLFYSACKGWIAFDFSLIYLVINILLIFLLVYCLVKS
jgi:hypothetical protein